MAFSLPTFNLTVNVWHFGHRPPAAPDDNFRCNLCLGRRVHSGEDVDVFGSASAQPMTLLLPLGSDIRSDVVLGGIQDYVEVPAGSGRKYIVNWVDDVAKGFPNEHRIAYILQQPGWPIPIP